MSCYYVIVIGSESFAVYVLINYFIFFLIIRFVCFLVFYVLLSVLSCSVFLHCFAYCFSLCTESFIFYWCAILPNTATGWKLICS